ncbi:SDR family oxidoreductase [Amycolatopsis sp. SID8362]|uniref:SDR family oxidoreductase n=1 Tax=Amycolatopsis sp. SID8362 TaxID=2690346 RepID=UPI001369994A|nr:SDR family oxidoreductase [Amycolatopsis sp. SID8362]NBH08075.1 NAD-dependent epimerase/dehydratase family protein [Amycolatopsis sp. SID8362]NED44769.1 SDR family oxidoreductase [Amycolatopsis sp. SID8362]
MRVFVTGASGWIGSAVVPELLGAGHEVVGLARSDASAAAVEAMGADVLRGDLTDLDTLKNAAASADGVVHLAFGHDFTRIAESIETDARAVEALGSAVAGKPFVAASGTPVVAGRPSAEQDEPEGFGPLAGRLDIARSVVAMAGRGVRSSVVRLPRSVHGEGDRHGFIVRLVEFSREKGAAAYVGDGTQRWPAVHVLDAAHLFRLALEEAPAGSVLHAVGDEGVEIREIAAVIGRHLELPTASVPAEELGFLGGILAVDQPARSAHTRELLGWRPTRPGLLEDIEKGHYFG